MYVCVCSYPERDEQNKHMNITKQIIFYIWQVHTSVIRPINTSATNLHKDQGPGSNDKQDS